MVINGRTLEYTIYIIAMACIKFIFIFVAQLILVFNCRLGFLRWFMIYVYFDFIFFIFFIFIIKAYSFSTKILTRSKVYVIHRKSTYMIRHNWQYRLKSKFSNYVKDLRKFLLLIRKWQTIDLAFVTL